MRRHTLVTIAVLFACLATNPSPLQAQGRGVRRAPARPVYFGSYYYRPFFYDSWFPPYFTTFGPSPYGYRTAYGAESALRIQVTPSDAQVFIDGYLAGTVDDFDGFFQRLHVEPGGHEITLFKDGYRTVQERLYVQPNETIKVRYSLQALQPADPPAVRPAPQARPLPGRPPTGRGPRGGGPFAPRGRDGTTPDNGPQRE